MKKKILLSIIIICLGVIAFGAIGASADTYGDLTYTISDGEVTITDCNSSATEVIIPEEIDGYPVKFIGDWAFYDCTSLTDITIPDSVTTIGGYAFYRCKSLTDITISDSVTTIEDYSFEHCTSLTDITIPDSVTTIGEGAFWGCTSLTDINIPDSVNTIGNYAFYDCTSLTNVYYSGSEDDWKKIDIGYSNQCLTNATIHYVVPVKNYSVKFNLNGGTGSCPEQEVSEGDYVVAPNNPTKEGYIFAGWYTDESYITEWDFETDVVVDNLNLYAKWEDVVLKVVPYTNSTVTKSSTSCNIEMSIYNVSGTCNIVVVGYKNKQFVSLQSRPYSQEHETFTLSNDIDEIKVMLWDGLVKLKPLCDAEVITGEQWINN